MDAVGATIAFRCYDVLERPDRPGKFSIPAPLQSGRDILNQCGRALRETGYVGSNTLAQVKFLPLVLLQLLDQGLSRHAVSVEAT